MTPILVAGMLTVDTLLRSPDAPGSLRIISERSQCVGGKGYLVAHTLAGLGSPVQLLAELATDKELPEPPAAGIDLLSCPRVLDDFDRTWTIHFGHTEESTFVQLGQRISAPPDYPRVLRSLPTPLATYVGAAPRDLVATIAEEQRLHTLLIVNASDALFHVVGGHNAPLLRDLVGAATVVLLNRPEFATLAGRDPLESTHLSGSVLEGVPIVVVTLGEQGALLIEPHGCELIPTTSADEVSSTLGAGDVFAGGWIGSFLIDGNAQKACHQGAALARAKVARFSSHL
jgi:sugar/nucleoside kinase (ribokinase family)